MDLAKILTELKIFRELLNLKNNKNNSLKEIDLKKLRYIVNKIKTGERQQEEMEFLEQIWFILNPNNNQYISKDTLEGFLKLLFSYSDNLNSQKDIVSYIKDYLNIVHFMEPKNKDNNILNQEEEQYYNSPLRNKIFFIKDIWSIEKLVKFFLKLKKNLIAYERPNYYYKQMENTFKEKGNNLKKNNKNKIQNFDRLYKIYMEKKEIREKTLKKLREVQEKENLSKCTYKPKITKKDNRKENEENDKNKIPVYEKLYMRRKDKEKIISNLKEKYKDEKIKKENEINNLSFQPEKFSDNNNIKTKFIINKQPKGSQKYIKRNRSFIHKKQEERKREEDKYTGRNYEKIMKMNFQPPKIKDLEKEEKYEDKEYINKICKKYKISFPDDIIYKNENNKNLDEEDFYIDIKIPSGKIVKLKVNVNEDINKKVIEFCKIYGLNDNIKQKLIKKFEEYKEYYYCYNKHQEEEDEENENYQ